MFVSDPQILGETFEKSIYSDIAIHDSDQYLKNTFARAYAYAKPDVICFLGDLLDEGSIASDEAYKRYLYRFKSIFKTSASVKKFYIPGDNDIGGEGKDYVTAFKTSRFHKGFNESSSMNTNNHLRFLNINLLTHIYPDLNESDTITTTNKLINIVLTHISVLSYPGLTMKTVSLITYLIRVNHKWFIYLGRTFVIFMSYNIDSGSIQAKYHILGTFAFITFDYISAAVHRKTSRSTHSHG